MAPGPLTNQLPVDTQRLVPNCSTQSFYLDENEQVMVNMMENEVTITRPIDHRKYSMMSFKPRAKNTNTIDITIGEGKYNTVLEPIECKNFTSQDIRKKSNFCARLAVGFVFALILGMCVLLLVTVLKDHTQKGSDCLLPITGLSNSTFNSDENNTVIIYNENSTGILSLG